MIVEHSLPPVPQNHTQDNARALVLEILPRSTQEKKEQVIDRLLALGLSASDVERLREKVN